MKIIFSDLDGTIYSNNKKIDPQTKKDIIEIQKDDFLFVIATGNGLFKKILNLAKEIKTRYIISSNGAQIFDLKKNEVMLEKFIDKDNVLNIIKLANKKKLALFYWDDKKVYANNYAKNNSDIIKKSMGVVPIILKNDMLNNILKMEIYGNEKKINQFQKEIIKKKYYYIRMKSNHIEMTNKNANKSFAIKWIANKLNVKIDDCMMIGDSDNDIDALKSVKYSYAMANANNNVKSNVNFHTSRVEQNGLSEALEDYKYRLEKGMDKK